MDIFSCPTKKLNKKKEKIHQQMREKEVGVLARILPNAELSDQAVDSIQSIAKEWVKNLRKKRLSGISLDAFFMQYQLSSEEGIALMCLAEALLRIPDKHNIDKMIADKISDLDWLSQTGKSDSFLVNASTWGLVLGSQIVPNQSKKNFLTQSLATMTNKLGGPILRKAIKQGMAILGQQFVMGETIEDAHKRAEKNKNKQYLYSYDMLGEGARTAADAKRYFEYYKHAIKSLYDEKQLDVPLYDRPSISVKLSALHPRYEWAKKEQCVAALSAYLKELAHMAMHAHIGLTVDAEEADRLDLSLLIFENVFADPDLKDWAGLGLAVQAYFRCTQAVIEWLIQLAQQYNKKIPIRLVKGAYWDTEIKDSQVRGLIDFPVFTRKISTDVHYIACMKQMIAAIDWIYPQFATHNAFSVSAAWHLLPDPNAFEFQCLHGMGQTLYDQVLTTHPDLRCRNYAPVGKHEELLPYLVRRLLENGANSSFVNRILNPDISVDELIASPMAKVSALSSEELPHPAITPPRMLFGNTRPNSKGLNLNEAPTTYHLCADMNTLSIPQEVGPLIAGLTKYQDSEKVAVLSPAKHQRQITSAYLVTTDQINRALNQAHKQFAVWHQQPVSKRANILRKAANLLESRQAEFIALCCLEAGKVWQDGIDEVREAVDFLNYYAHMAEQELSPKICPGPTGELNTWQPLGRGIIVCISPWNFPLAIFTGQVAAALAAGNCVIAKPATQTITIAHQMVQLLYQAGIPKSALQLLPGRRQVLGEPLLKDPRVQGVMLTGSTHTGKMMAQTLAHRPGPIIPLIAETGGQNAMIVDSTALPEQVIFDVVESAFKSAGQRCSALRVLFIQDDIAEKLLTMLAGAMATLTLGDPTDLPVDIGPVIDQKALDALHLHETYLETQNAQLIARCQADDDLLKQGYFFQPIAYEIASLDILKEEVFGPFLHVIRFKGKDLEKVVEQINATGYGLTLGIHSRIEKTVNTIIKKACVGNIYVNRNMIGAVVGVQPFGGEGLSGTGPKAGGPWYLTRLCREQTTSINTTAVGGNATLMSIED